jgi:hypothetical protein
MGPCSLRPIGQMHLCFLKNHCGKNPRILPLLYPLLNQNPSRPLLLQKTPLEVP